jgi:hypothetical protein
MLQELVVLVPVIQLATVTITATQLFIGIGAEIGKRITIAKRRRQLAQKRAIKHKEKMNKQAQ